MREVKLQTPNTQMSLIYLVDHLLTSFKRSIVIHLYYSSTCLPVCICFTVIAIVFCSQIGQKWEREHAWMSTSEGPHVSFVEDNWNQLTGGPNSDPALSFFHALIWLLYGPAKHLASLANMNNGDTNGWQGKTDNHAILQCYRSFLLVAECYSSL